MSKATVVFTDTPHGTVAIEISFDPVITEASQSDAQRAAIAAVELLQQYMQSKPPEAQS